MDIFIDIQVVLCIFIFLKDITLIKWQYSKTPGVLKVFTRAPNAITK